MKAKVCSLALGLSFLSPLANATEHNRECQITFPFNSARVDAKALSVCLEVLNLKAGAEVEIKAYASPEGTPQHNLKLSRERAQNVKTAMNRKLKGLVIHAQGLGEHQPEGRAAILIKTEKTVAAVEAKAEKIPGTKVAALGSPDTVSTKTASSPSRLKGNWRAAVRSGFDTTRIEQREEYFAPGLDVAYLPDLANPSIRLELGALASLYAEGNRNRLDSYHFAPMLGYQQSGYIAGLRGLAGNVLSHESDKTYLDTGAELRLGVEKDQWSLFLGAGRTSTLNRVGMDFGLRF